MVGLKCVALNSKRKKNTNALRSRVVMKKNRTGSPEHLHTRHTVKTPRPRIVLRPEKRLRTRGTLSSARLVTMVNEIKDN